MSPHPSPQGVPGLPPGGAQCSHTHPCWGPWCPLTHPHQGVPAAPNLSAMQGMGQCCRAPNLLYLLSTFYSLYHPSNNQRDVYTLASRKPKQNGVFCTGGRYLWLVAKADNASSRDLLCVVQ